MKSASWSSRIGIEIGIAAEIEVEIKVKVKVNVDENRLNYRLIAWNRFESKSQLAQPY